ncbi:bifunctional metallophosphatase/5'-nucleotidase [Novosphingobium aerophilum]|uniref:Bifunctional metallophosphatase/5'-nucleotidase n=1 Tax=Novosphingobium aerophilum TaxID=2839843 RepID=A0A7X1F963_9SPHN|nr:bifunctional metallophosphatase/5'-nucleotidase [Novosphingobium aerophilum]MBC2652682.1 bifunctional metallophosphatase/5'-nucleotidase [Novosphingobium aerophilum]
MHPAPFVRVFLIGGALLALAACAGSPRPIASAPAPTAPVPSEPVTIGIAAINDFHGNLEPPKQAAMLPDGQGGTASVPAGGAAYLATAVRQVRAQYPHHLTIAAGDLMGSSPLASALFLDEPAVEVMNRIGLDFNAVGNHEFDYGVPELLRKQSGGCAQHTERRPCQVEPFRGAQFRFLAANTVNRADGRTLFPGTALRSFGSGPGKVTVGLIGLTLKGTSDLVNSKVNAAVAFNDEAETANALVGSLKAQGADAVILVIHEGGRTSGDPDPNGCNALSGGIRPILDRLDRRVDLVISGHTHWAYVCEVAQPGRDQPLLLTSAGLWGEYVTDIAIQIDPVTHRMVGRRAKNVIVQSEAYNSPLRAIPNSAVVPRFSPDPDIAGYVARYVAASQAYVKRPVGWLAEPLEKAEGDAWGTGGRLGNLIADAQLEASRGAGARIACTNPFGIRRSLLPGPDHVVTYGDLYLVQPFGSELITLTLTGAELKEALEQQLDKDAPEQLLACSAGFIQTIDRSRPIGDRVVGATLDGAPIDPAQSYRITVNAYLANGGDSFAAFVKGRERTIGMTDIAALEAYLKPAQPIRSASREVRVKDLRPELKTNNLKAPPGITY